MEISTSILSIKDNIKGKVLLLKNTDTTYIHLDVMDGKFVNNISSYSYLKDELKNTCKCIDVHLMVEDVEKYLDEYKELNPTYITFHLESNFDLSTIDKIKTISKVGIAINPDTKIEELKPYMDKVDMILLMSVIPGKGGQTFMPITVQRLKELKEYQKTYSFKIEVDGGINDQTINLVKEADIIVSGSYITNSNNYNEKIKNLLS